MMEREERSELRPSEGAAEGGLDSDACLDVWDCTVDAVAGRLISRMAVDISGTCSIGAGK